jgi:hypothetical protein
MGENLVHMCAPPNREHLCNISIAQCFKNCAGVQTPRVN